MGNSIEYEYSFHVFQPTLDQVIPLGAERAKIFAEYGVIAIPGDNGTCSICLAKSLRRTVEDEVIKKTTHDKNDVARFRLFHATYFPEQSIGPYIYTRLLE